MRLGDMRALLGEGMAHRRADATAPAGHQYGFLFQISDAKHNAGGTPPIAQ